MGGLSRRRRDGALTPVVIDHRNNQWAEALDGLSAGDQVILHPSDRVADGGAVLELLSCTAKGCHTTPR